MTTLTRPTPILETRWRNYRLVRSEAYPVVVAYVTGLVRAADLAALVRRLRWAYYDQLWIIPAGMEDTAAIISKRADGTLMLDFPDGAEARGADTHLIDLAVMRLNTAIIGASAPDLAEPVAG